MSNTVSLQGPIGSSITLSYGSTGLPIVSATDPQFPSGGYGGPLESGQISSSINQLQSNINQNNNRILELNLKIASTRDSQVIPASEKQALIQSYQNEVNGYKNQNANFTNSITIASYLASNISSLTAKLKAAQASTTTNTAASNTGSNQTAPKVSPNDPTAIVVNTKPVGNTKTASTTNTGIVVNQSAIPSGNIKSTPLPTSDPSVINTNIQPVGNVAVNKPIPTTDPNKIVVNDEANQQAAANAQANASQAASAADLTNTDATPKVISIAAQQDSTKFQARKDWRVRLALSDDASVNYLYKAPDPGILKPLVATNGIVFPYTPTININYSANYTPIDLTHSNYKVNQYSNSSVDNVSITCDFTAQDTYEANYLLAVIHFIRSAMKMFYGQDENPKRGTPPPLVYLFGLGTFQFSAHPLAISGFTYNLPNDCDYIKTVAPSDPGTQQPTGNTGSSQGRLPQEVAPGGTAQPPKWSGPAPGSTGEVTWVPTKIQLSISCVVIQSRNQVSNKFSFRDYATGDLLNGIKNPGGAFW
jgi:hypothetical protein